MQKSVSLGHASPAGSRWLVNHPDLVPVDQIAGLGLAPLHRQERVGAEATKELHILARTELQEFGQLLRLGPRSRRSHY